MQLSDEENDLGNILLNITFRYGYKIRISIYFLCFGAFNHIFRFGFVFCLNIFIVLEAFVCKFIAKKNQLIRCKLDEKHVLLSSYRNHRTMVNYNDSVVSVSDV